MADLLGWTKKNILNPIGSAVHNEIFGPSVMQDPGVQRAQANLQQVLQSRAKYGVLSQPKVQQNFVLQNSPATYNPVNDTIKSLLQSSARTVPELGGTLMIKPMSVTPTGWQKAIFGSTPIQNIEAKVQSNYQQHPKLPGWERVGLSGLEGVGSLANDVMMGLPVAKGLSLGVDAAIKGAPAIEKGLVTANKFATEKGLGLSIKDVSNQFSKEELAFMKKNHLSPDMLKKGQVVDAEGNPIKAPTYTSESTGREIPIDQMNSKHAQNALNKLIQNGQKETPTAKALREQVEATKPAKSDKLPPFLSSTESQYNRLQSLQYRANRLGQSGKVFLQKARDMEIGTKQLTQKLMDRLPTFKDLTPEERTLAIDVKEGNAKTNDPYIKQAVNELNDFYKTTEQKYNQVAKKPLKSRGDNYFNHNFPKNYFNKQSNFNGAVNHLLQTGQAKDVDEAVALMNRYKQTGSFAPNEFGNFKERTLNIPGYNKDLQAVQDYAQGAAKRIMGIKHYGEKGEKLYGLVNQARKNREDAVALNDVINTYMNPKFSTPNKVNKLVGGYQKALNVAFLKAAAIAHIPQLGVQTGADVGWGNVIKATANRIFNTGDKQFLHDSGMLTEGMNKPKGLSNQVTAPGLHPMMQQYRNISAIAGKYKAEQLAREGDAQGLRARGVGGDLTPDTNGEIHLTNQQKIQAGHWTANENIGSNSRLESAAWTEGTAGKMVSQFMRGYVLKEGERIVNLINRARSGDADPLLRFLVGAPAAGVSVAIAKQEISHPGSNPLPTDAYGAKNLALNTLKYSGLPTVGMGIPERAINVAGYSNNADSLLRNVAGAVAPGLGFAVETGQNIGKAMKGQPNSLQRQGLHMVPFAGGTLADKYAPTPYSQQQAIANNPNLDTSNLSLDEINKLTSSFVKNIEKTAKSGTYGLEQAPSGKYVATINGKVSSYDNLPDAQNAIAKDAFKNSNKNFQIIGDMVYRKNAAGKVQEPEPKITYEHKLNDATMKEQKKNKDVKGWMATAQKQLDNITKQLNDPNADPLDTLNLQNEAQTIVDDMAKYTAYGGFTKGSGGGSSSSVPRLNLKTAANITIPKVSKITPKNKPTLKMASTSVKKMSVSKIPTNYLTKKARRV